MLRFALLFALMVGSTAAVLHPGTGRADVRLPPNWPPPDPDADPESDKPDSDEPVKHVAGAVLLSLALVLFGVWVGRKYRAMSARPKVPAWSCGTVSRRKLDDKVVAADASLPVEK